MASVYRAPLFEFFFDSARSIFDLLLSGTVLRLLHIQGMPSLALRERAAESVGSNVPGAVAGSEVLHHDGALDMTEEQIKSALRHQFGWDLVGDPVPN